MEFASNLKRLRKAAGYTQEALAKKLSLTAQAVSRWETGDGYPEITLLPTLADLLGVTVDALLRPAALTGEALYAVIQETLRLQQTGKEPEAIAFMEAQLAAHPETDSLRERLAVALLWQGRRFAKEGNAVKASDALRRGEAAAEALQSSDSSWLRYRAEALLPEFCYRLGEKEKLRELQQRAYYSDPFYSSLANCAVGKDFLYVFERAVLYTVFSMNSYLYILAWRPEANGAAWHDPGETGEPLIYDPAPGEGEWSVSPAERYEIDRFRAELMEFLSGGEGFGPIRAFETEALRQMLTVAAQLEDPARVLEALGLFTERFASRELLEWEKQRILALDSYRLALEGLMRKGIGRAEAEVEAVAQLTPWEKELMTEPVSPLPALKHVQLFRVFWRDPPMLPVNLEEVSKLLKEGRFDFVRREPRFQALSAQLDALVKELEKTGELPVKNMEQRRGLPQ